MRHRLHQVINVAHETLQIESARSGRIVSKGISGMDSFGCAQPSLADWD
jgi:hypothetical protein